MQDWKPSADASTCHYSQLPGSAEADYSPFQEHIRPHGRVHMSESKESSTEPFSAFALLTFAQRTKLAQPLMMGYREPGKETHG